MKLLLSFTGEKHKQGIYPVQSEISNIFIVIYLADLIASFSLRRRESK